MAKDIPSKRKLMATQDAIEAYYLQESINKLNTKFNEKKGFIADYMAEFDVKDIVFPIEDSTASKKAKKKEVVVSRTKRIFINWIPQKLQKVLDKELYNEVVVKEYTITNMEKLVKILKKAGIKSKDIKDCISVSKQADRTRLEQLFQAKEITVKQLEGCYKAKTSHSISFKKRSVSD